MIVVWSKSNICNIFSVTKTLSYYIYQKSMSVCCKLYFQYLHIKKLFGKRNLAQSCLREFYTTKYDVTGFLTYCFLWTQHVCMLVGICVSSYNVHDSSQSHVIDLFSLPRQSKLPSLVSHQPRGQGGWRRPAVLQPWPAQQLSYSMCVQKAGYRKSVCEVFKKSLCVCIYLSLHACAHIVANKHHAHSSHPMWCEIYSCHYHKQMSATTCMPMSTLCQLTECACGSGG